MNIDNAKKIIGYEPKVDLQDGLKRTWNWYLKNMNENDLRHNYFKNDKTKTYDNWILEKTSLDGVVKIIPSVFKDFRGEYIETYNKDFMIENKIDINFLQDDISVSKKNVLRGSMGMIPGN